MHIFAIPKRELLAWKVLIWCVMATLYSYEPRIFFFARNEVPKKFFFYKNGKSDVAEFGTHCLEPFLSSTFKPKTRKSGRPQVRSLDSSCPDFFSRAKIAYFSPRKIPEILLESRIWKSIKTTQIKNGSENGPKDFKQIFAVGKFARNGSQFNFLIWKQRYDAINQLTSLAGSETDFGHFGNWKKRWGK